MRSRFDSTQPSASIRERLVASQAAEDQDGEGAVDYLIEVPVELAQTLTGFRHDQIVLVRSDKSEVPPELSPPVAVLDSKLALLTSRCLKLLMAPPKARPPAPEPLVPPLASLDE